MDAFDAQIDRRETGSLKWDRFALQQDEYGREVLPLWVADMDFSAAPEILDALHERVDHGVFGYTKPWNAAENAVIEYLAGRHGYAAEASWLHWIHGCVPALNVFARAFGQDGEILTCTPVYPPFLTAPQWQGSKLATCHLMLRDERWTFDTAAMEEVVNDRTRAFILCNPHNPVGTVFKRSELEWLADFCCRHDLILCSDEIHCDLVFEGATHIMTATLGGAIAERTVTLHAPSKTWNLPGLSAAYAVIPNRRLRARFAEAARGFVTEVNALGYTGLMAAYGVGEPWRRKLIQYLTGNRDWLYAFVAAELLPWMRFDQQMEATYLAWLNVEGMREQGIRDPHAFLLSKAGVGLSPGVDFHDGRFLRINFGCPRSVLVEAMERIRDALVAQT